MDSQHSHRDCECSQRSGGGQLRAPWGGRKSTPGRRTRGAMLAKYLTLAVLAGMLNVGRGNHEQGTYVPCEVIEGVNLSPDRNVDSVKRTEWNPGRFVTINYDSPDTTIRWVMEYSTDPSFANVPPLNLHLPIFDKTAAVSSDGVDLANDFDLDEAGRVKGGRFVFTKLTPFDEFNFPKTRVLENGVMYYFKNYKVRDGCVSPPLDTHSKHPSEVMTRPSMLQSQGYASAVRSIRHMNVSSDWISLKWDYPVDSGNNRTIIRVDSLGMEVGYQVTAIPVAGEDGSVGAGAVRKVRNVKIEGIVLQNLKQGQLYRLIVQVNNTMGISPTQDRELMGRPVGLPQQPSDLKFQINPFNLTNATGNRNGSLTWREPLDTGLGVPCDANSMWTSCAQYPLVVDRYEVKRMIDKVLHPVALSPQDSTAKQINVSFAPIVYNFMVSARNRQGDVLGRYSSDGPYANTTSHGQGVLSGKPVKMRILYYPWATNVSAGNVGVADEAVMTPAQGRGISDYCFREGNSNSSAAGVTDAPCPADSEDADVLWVPPAQCARCKDPELSVFVDSAYTFKVRAVKEQDLDFAEFDPEDIRIEHNLQEIFGLTWTSMVDLNYSTFRCRARSDSQHWSDQEACDAVNQSTSQNGGPFLNVQGYGWKEVAVAFTANKAMAASGFTAHMCFTAVTPTNKRSQMCIDVRVIRPDPQFFEFTLKHSVTMGCRFSTDVSAEDRTELGLRRETALEKNYLVGIKDIGGRIESLYRSTPFPALPAGAKLFPKGNTMATNNSITYRFQWTPKRFQEGFVYLVNLEARGYLGESQVPGVVGSPLREITLRINVLRCRFCTETSDSVSLSNLASEWRASWLSIWSGNHVLVDVDTVEETTVQLGPVMKVASTVGCDREVLGDLCNDDLAHISRRYGVEVQDLLWWNPDLSDEAGRKNHYQLYQDQEICVLPNTCVNSAHIYSGGF